MQTNIQILMAFAKNFQHKRFQFWGQQENTWIENKIFMDVSVHYLGQIHMHLAFLRTAFSKWFMNNMFSRIRTLTNTVCRPQLVEIKICQKQSHPPQNTVEEIHYLCPNENQIHEICSKIWMTTDSAYFYIIVEIEEVSICYLFMYVCQFSHYISCVGNSIPLEHFNFNLINQYKLSKLSQ